jgi:anaphase-promoting complex subunit 6
MTIWLIDWLVLLQTEHSINLLRGKIYEAMDNRNLAVECYREALRQDIYCFEAFDLLVNHHMLTAQEGLLTFH